MGRFPAAIELSAGGPATDRWLQFTHSYPNNHVPDARSPICRSGEEISKRALASMGSDDMRKCPHREHQRRKYLSRGGCICHRFARFRFSLSPSSSVALRARIRRCSPGYTSQRCANESTLCRRTNTDDYGRKRRSPNCRCCARYRSHSECARAGDRNSWSD